MRSLDEHKLINEAKKRYRDIEGLKSIKVDYEDEYIGKLRLGNSGIYAPKWAIEEPIAESPKHILVSGFDQGGDDEMNVYIVINKKKSKIIDYQHWGYDKLLPIYFKNAKVKESKVNESRFKSFHHVAILADDVFDIDLKGTDKEFTYTDADGNIIKVKVINPNKANVDGKMYNILDFAKLISGDDVSVLESKVNEAKKRYNNIKGLNREFGDGDEYDTGIQRYWRNERKGTFVYAYNSQIENPMAETPKHILVSGYEDYGDDTKNAFLVINKKKREIIDYDVWNYDNLLPIYFKNVKLKRTSAYESNVNESDEQMSEMEIRKAMAESGKMTVKQMMDYMKMRYAGKYDLKVARANAKELVADMKKYM